MATDIPKVPHHFEMIKVLGEGSYGKVLHCVEKDTQKAVALKVLKSKMAKGKVNREVYMMENLRHLDPDQTNIVRFYETFNWLDRTYIVFEKLNISLYHYISQKKPIPLSLLGVRTVTKDMAVALKALKNIGVIHTDIKLENIMLVDPKTRPYRVKLIDFGCALRTTESRPGLTVQPLCYRSPEILLGSPFNEAIDVWALGVCLAEIFLGFSLLRGSTEYDMLHSMINFMGAPSKQLLNAGTKTHLYYNSNQQCLFKRWTFKTPAEFSRETNTLPKEYRRSRFSSFNDLKTWCLGVRSSQVADEVSACVDLLKEMLQIDSIKRTTATEILLHPFITIKDAPKKTSNSETSVPGPSTSKALNVSANKKTDDRSESSPGCSTHLPEQVEMVPPDKWATKKEEAINKGSNCSDIQMEDFSNTDLAKPSLDRGFMSVPSGNSSTDVSES